MAYGLAGAHREELKGKQLLSLRTELRSYRLNDQNQQDRPKYVRYSMEHQEEQGTCPKLCNRCSDSACCRRANRHLALGVVFA